MQATQWRNRTAQRPKWKPESAALRSRLLHAYVYRSFVFSRRARGCHRGVKNGCQSVRQKAKSCGRGRKRCQFLLYRLFLFRPCAFFSMFLVTFFSPNLRGRAEKKQNVQRKKTHWLSVPDHLTDNDAPTDSTVAHCVEHSHSFFFLSFLFPNDDKVKQLPVATVRKFDFFPVAFRGQRTLLTLFNRSTSRTHSSSRPEITR